MCAFGFHIDYGAFSGQLFIFQPKRYFFASIAWLGSWADSSTKT
jgi:hypothetical protein